MGHNNIITCNVFSKPISKIIGRQLVYICDVIYICTYITYLLVFMSQGTANVQHGDKH